MVEEKLFIFLSMRDILDRENFRHILFGVEGEQGINCAIIYDEQFLHTFSFFLIEVGQEIFV